MKAILISFCFCFSSCQVLLSTILGVEEPVAKNDVEIAHNLRNRYPSYPLYRVKENKMDSLLRAEYKTGWGPGFRPIQFICFNNKGKLVTQWASCESGQNSYTLKEFPPRSKYPSNPEFDIKKVIDIVKPLSPDNANLNTYENYEYTYVVYVTSWTDKLSSDLVESIKKYAASNKYTYNIVLVSADYYKTPSSLKN
ncbi:hypothetical protein [Hymenobacter lapidiphilus]|uniref:Uncharacterized protein n=1 Tax=Hymenobacter lapidiphilus TaxID=2608003 RepID=A0A7Y7PMW4_9BACT|nr:hypothetical protein [Hymenobacter lapidiphilus]NVO30744.1 hypothetical protein [Hymenobacter lapidiphilus]